MKELLSILADIFGGAMEHIDYSMSQLLERYRIVKLYADPVSALF
ncbi:unnamed protein product [Protopolystoma xenopodis]|uniref:Uncharacterized protein n=1 Tax=Protopolystoma xenopodis TaxID=117903 RepID=A0A3S5CHQ4_9PLAT|nr:unnamed protein product [Protopolystoma xenopodis]